MAKRKSGGASKELVRYHFDSVQDMVAYSDKQAAVYPKVVERCIKHAFKDVYDVLPSHSDAKDKAIAGCHELYQKHFSKAEFNIERSGGKRIDYHNAITGMYVDVDAYLQGVPECFVDEVLTDDASNKFVDIVVNCGIYAGVKNEVVINKLKGVVSLIDSYEKSGFRTSVKIYNKSLPTKGGLKPYEFMFTIKTHEQPINIEQMIFLVGSPVINRFFKWLIVSEIAGDKDYGEYASDTKHESELVADKSIVYIPSFFYDYHNGITNYDNLQNTYNLNTI